MIQAYGTKENFLRLFNPDKLVHYTNDVDRCFMGSAPTFAALTSAYGKEVTESWLMIQYSKNRTNVIFLIFAISVILPIYCLYIPKNFSK